MGARKIIKRVANRPHLVVKTEQELIEHDAGTLKNLQEIKSLLISEEIKDEEIIEKCSKGLSYIFQRKIIDLLANFNGNESLPFPSKSTLDINREFEATRRPGYFETVVLGSKPQLECTSTTLTERVKQERQIKQLKSFFVALCESSKTIAAEKNFKRNQSPIKKPVAFTTNFRAMSVVADIKVDDPQLCSQLDVHQYSETHSECSENVERTPRSSAAESDSDQKLPPEGDSCDSSQHNESYEHTTISNSSFDHSSAFTDQLDSEEPTPCKRRASETNGVNTKSGKEPLICTWTGCPRAESKKPFNRK
ncbi:hypothetical protein Ciccas_008673 [Cichlidogyrus casuarinus]|uniref:Uncharacterized protein n=1 Tax=Cichlidogyrus casuarinus TaxID=1844966 RepID=A0ABD2PZS9_9PLAT